MDNKRLLLCSFCLYPANYFIFFFTSLVLVFIVSNYIYIILYSRHVSTIYIYYILKIPRKVVIIHLKNTNP